MTGADDRDRSVLLQAAFDDELDAAGVVEVERMLDADPEARRDYARLEALRKAIRAHAPREEAPAALRARVLAAIDATPAPAPQVGARRWPDRPSWRSFGAAIAATIVLTLGLHGLVTKIGAPDPLAPFIVAAHMRSQISDRPVDVASSDRHVVKPWLAGKLPMPVMVVDLAAEGFPLAGARIDIVAGAPAPTLIYRRREHLVSVAELRPEFADYPAEPSRRTIEGYPLVVWKDKDRAYAAVSDLLPVELDAFVAAFRRAAAMQQGDAATPRDRK